MTSKSVSKNLKVAGVALGWIIIIFLSSSLLGMLFGLLAYFFGIETGSLNKVIKNYSLTPLRLFELTFFFIFPILFGFLWVNHTKKWEEFEDTQKSFENKKRLILYGVRCANEKEALEDEFKEFCDLVKPQYSGARELKMLTILFFLATAVLAILYFSEIYTNHF